MTAPIVAYTGTQVWTGKPEVRPSAGKRMAHGAGLYFTTSLQTAKKYGKGSRTVLRVEIDPSIHWLEDAVAPTNVLVTWVAQSKMKTSVKTKIVDDLIERGTRGAPPGHARVSSLVALMVNYGAVSGQTGVALAEFLASLDIGGDLIQRAGEQWLVIFDPSKVLRWRRVTEEDPWDLPPVKRTSRP